MGISYLNWNDIYEVNRDSTIKDLSEYMTDPLNKKGTFKLTQALSRM